MAAKWKRSPGHERRLAWCRPYLLLPLLLTVAIGVYPALAANDGSLEVVRLQLKWRHQFQFAGYYAALEKGYFRDAGLEVELLEGRLELDIGRHLLSGQAEFGVMSPAVLLERRQGRPLVVMAAIFQHSASVILADKKSGVRSPRDLVGKRVMFARENDPEHLAMLTKEGIALKSLHMLPHTWQVDGLLDGSVDAQTAYLPNEPFLLRELGGEPVLIKPTQYGIDFYGDCLVTSEREVRQHPERVEAFRRAVLRGWGYAMNNPEEIARLIQSRYSQEKSLESLLHEAEAMRELINPNLVEIGYMSVDRWQAIAETYVRLGFMPAGYDLKGLMYDELRQEMEAERQGIILLVAEMLGGVLLVGCGIGWILLLFNSRLSREVQKRTADLAASEQSFRTFFEMASVGVAEIDTLSGRFLQINVRFCELVGYTEEEMLSRSLAEITLPEDCERNRQLRHDLVDGTLPEFTIEERLLHRNGQAVWVIVTVSPLWRAGEPPGCCLAVVRDISKRKRAEEELLFAAKVFEHSIEGIMVTDQEGTILQVNPAFTQITGYSAEEAVGNTPKLLKSNRHEPSFYRTMWEQLGRDGQWSGEIWNRRRDGEVYPEWQTVNAVRNPLGQVTNYVCIFHDISELKRQQEALEHQAQHDALTGLPNRVLFNDRLQMALARMRRKASRLALLFLDLDNFKHINDSFGHTAGDNLLMAMSRRLKGQLRASDTLARQGGDEFLVLLPEIGTAEDAGLIATRLLECLRVPFFHENIEYYVSASIGVTIAPDDGANIDDLIKNADIAMYRAKKQGRDSYQFFTSELDSHMLRRFYLESNLRKSIELEEFELYYQPQVSGATGRIVGAEALVRWRHEGMLVSPAEFIPLAEESGLILALGNWVLRTAVRQVKAWQDAGYELNVSVNISSRQFASQQLPIVLRDVLVDTGLKPGRIYFELTESILMDDVGRAQRLLEELRPLGGKFYLDDFGTGYSSLSYLKRLALDGLKIDRAFIHDLEDDAGSRAIAAAIVSLAETLGLTVVAEGIETEAQLAILRGMSKNMLIQGYLASPPVPVEQMTSLLARGERLL
ncbi:MAG: EAL domain-containing protein [Desulfobulbus sp.]|uniref:EAL domain-containing protein n=1 Tax=Desulfobulbus sp. TaxID=895 RepID=UPI00284B6BAA|nr:EAL domain-containing protein [Desulfobulbus sp.]MDR2550684.1 EAL domain-containing protein [Desulfobulbus sp.]